MVWEGPPALHHTSPEHEEGCVFNKTRVLSFRHGEYFLSFDIYCPDKHSSYYGAQNVSNNLLPFPSQEEPVLLRQEYPHRSPQRVQLYLLKFNCIY